jgi:hypothetical protein
MPTELPPPEPKTAELLLITARRFTGTLIILIAIALLYLRLPSEAVARLADRVAGKVP